MIISKFSKIVLISVSLLFLINNSDCANKKDKHNSLNKKWKILSCFMGTFFPWTIGFHGPSIIAGINKYKPASQQLLNHIKNIFSLSLRRFESVYVGNMHFFGAYVADYKTLLLRKQYDEDPSLLTLSLLEHEYAHSVRYSTEKIRLACIIVPLITYFGIQFVCEKLSKSKNSRIRAICERVNRWSPLFKSLLFGFGLFLLNQHILAAFARWEECMTDRTADMLFNNPHNHAYSSKNPESILEILRIILLPGFFWNHPIKNEKIDHININLFKDQIL
jgi:hypothetical protein